MVAVSLVKTGCAMTTISDDEVRLPQREVQRLLGRSLLQLQQYERLIKAMIADQTIAGPANSAEAIQANRKADTVYKSTLGRLVKDLLGSYLVNEIGTPDEETANSSESVNSFVIRLRLELSDADFSRTEAELSELVLLRNDLVHHFINRHDLWSVDGCRRAHDALVAACKRIDQHYEQLQKWAEHMLHTRGQIFEVLKSDDFHELVVNGVAPDGTVNWPSAGIVCALRKAADELAVDGWTSISEASKRIVDRDPEQVPAKYGCSSWRQVLNESREFKIQYFEVDGQRIARYRDRTNPTDSS